MIIHAAFDSYNKYKVLISIIYYFDVFLNILYNVKKKKL